MSLSIPLPFGWLLDKKAARVEVNISLAFLHWVGIALHSWPFVSDIAIFVMKGDIKLQLTNNLGQYWDEWPFAHTRRWFVTRWVGGSVIQWLGAGLMFHRVSRINSLYLFVNLILIPVPTFPTHFFSPITSSSSVLPLRSFITPSVFHFRLKIYLFYKSPP